MTIGLPSLSTTLLSPKNRLNAGVSGAFKLARISGLVTSNVPLFPVADLI
jgi:hypothetical protein